VTRPADEDGYELWLRYRRVPEPGLLERYRRQLTSIVLLGAAARDGGEPATPTLAAALAELRAGLEGLLGRAVPQSDDPHKPGALLLGRTLTPGLEEFRRPAAPPAAGVAEPLEGLGRDGFALVSSSSGAARTALVGTSDLGILYGAFQLLRLLQTGSEIGELRLASSPRLGLRILNHWDNLDRTVERGYAGFSLFPANASVLTVEFKVNLLAPAEGERIVAEGFVVKPGRTLCITRGEVHALRGDKRKLVAVMQQTLMVMHGKEEA